MSLSHPTFKIDDSIILRPIAVEDADELHALTEANRVYLRRWLPWLDGTREVADTRNFIVSVVERGTTGNGAVWGIERAGALCGVAGFNWVEPSNRVCEIGYWLSESHQGHGVVTRSVAALIHHAFEDLALNRITIPVAFENERSRAVPERLGFQREGVMREAEWLYDHFVDQILFTLIRREWPSSAAAT